MSTPNQRSILEEIARREMIARGLEPELSPQARAELGRLGHPPADGSPDFRSLEWSSIDNDESRDLDQLEVCVEDRKGPPRVLVAIADVDVLVRQGSALDAHARTNTTSVYTPARVFPMLPEELSNDRTSLNPDTDRVALIIDMRISDDGAVTESNVYRGVVRNRAKLTYDGVAAWLDGHGPTPEPIAASQSLEAQVRLQDQIAQRLRARREEDGALDFDRTEVKPVVDGSRVQALNTVESNRARDLIESFMIAANTTTAQFLAARGIASIRRVVRSPERWDRIVDLAAQHGGKLPSTPDVHALQGFLKARRAASPDDFSDLSLSVIKLLGRGEYVAEQAGGPQTQHFALATSNYTHSTAPNRRFPDLITQRLIKATLERAPSPYPLAELSALAEHCTRQEDAANKVERQVRKAAAALYLSDQIGQRFDAVVTGASPKGTWVRLTKPPVEGRLERGFEGLDVGDRLRVQLISTNPEKGFIDFARA